MRLAGTMLAAGTLAAALGGCSPSGDSGGGAGAAAAPSVEAKAVLATLPAAYQGADLDNGKLRFGQCRSCHTIAPDGADQTGPALHGVFGRKSGSRPGFHYSPALAAAGWTWDADHLDKWLADPRGYLPGTKMTFVGIKDDHDRRDLIAYVAVGSKSATP